MSHHPAKDRSASLTEHEVVTDNDFQQEDIAHEVRATVTALMPWGVSILAHVVLIVLAFFLVWQTIDVKDDVPPHAPTLANVPDAIAPSPEPTESESEATTGGPITVPTVPDIEPVTPKPLGPNPAKALVINVDIGLGPLVGPGPGTSDDGWLEDKPPRGIPANKIVYLVDASGSMVDVLPFVVNELKRVINKLDNRKQVTVIFFSGDGVYEVPGGGKVKGLRALDAGFKQSIHQWVSLENHRFETGGRGSAHVRQALARGLSYKPDLMFLLSDNLTGGGQGATRHELLQEDLIGVIQEHNEAPRSARINTIQFLYEDPLVRAGLEGTLMRIAKESGGTYQFISERDLMLR